VIREEISESCKSLDEAKDGRHSQCVTSMKLRRSVQKRESRRGNASWKHLGPPRRPSGWLGRHLDSGRRHPCPSLSSPPAERAAGKTPAQPRGRWLVPAAGGSPFRRELCSDSARSTVAGSGVLEAGSTRVAAANLRLKC
jgi:hypothetical protein